MVTNTPPADISQLLSEMNQSVRDKLSEAVELGKWPDGTKLSKSQTEQCMRAVMLWDSQYGQDVEEPFKVLKGGRLIDRAEKEDKTNTRNTEQDIDIKLQ